MLDLNDPQTRHIFEAAKLEDEMRPFLVAVRKENRKLEEGEESQIIAILHKLDTLNQQHFQSSEGTQKTIDRLRKSILKKEDANTTWNHFLELAETEGENFGTWMI
ncbi:hypothetical protein IEN85_08220 [Pelagicoccus sp. NFK12]|uniref:Uncharacterized protein n=1 Tax=Pelagicoccus enzymogenes TaxID=2773457 RepID=A0A927F6Q7_9BACT|nr:hypothetical protein [Pelagicoccus enzymogenes]MBD5779477.1 hypothetical protein [Pelagicoccus enzymogenes]